MSFRTPALVLVLLAVFPLQATMSIHPLAPTSGDAVTLRLETFCFPRGHSVVREQNVFRITLQNPTSCPDPPFRIAHEIPLGRLEPGNYVAQLPQEAILFTVRDSAPRLRVRPSVVPVDTPGFRIEFETDHGFEICTGVECNTMRIEIEDVTFRVGDTQGLPGPISIVAPDLTPGWKDVRITNNSGTHVFPAAVYYHQVNSEPDIHAFERILFPVLFSTGGLGGSRWVSEAVIANPTRWTIENANEVLPIVCVTYPCGERLEPRSRVAFDGEGYPRGVVLHVPRGEADLLAFSLRVRDVSRQAQGLGTEVPVVREHEMVRDADVTLLDVPRDPEYRTKVRIYAYADPVEDDGRDPVLRLVAPNGDRISETPFVLSRNCTSAKCSETPFYGEVDLAPGARGDRADVYVQLPSGWLGWAMASVTNNVTQQVTIVSPNGKGGRR